MNQITMLTLLADSFPCEYFPRPLISTHACGFIESEAQLCTKSPSQPHHKLCKSHKKVNNIKKPYFPTTSTHTVLAELEQHRFLENDLH